MWNSWNTSIQDGGSIILTKFVGYFGDLITNGFTDSPEISGIYITYILRDCSASFAAQLAREVLELHVLLEFQYFPPIGRQIDSLLTQN